jgi:hypothetical protein
MYETLLIDGVDLTSVVRCVQSIDGLYVVTGARGDNVVFPGVDGETWVDKPRGTGTVDLGILLAGNTTTEFNDSYRALVRLVKPGRRVNLERRMSYSSGNESHYSIGEYASGLAPTLNLARIGRTTLSMKILDGVWYAGSTTELVVPIGNYTADVAGDDLTHRMTITMAAGGYVQNTTTGHRLDVAANTGGNVVIDVVNMTATQDGNDVSYLQTFNQRYPFQLVPGDNDLDSDNGFTIDYYQAYP